MLGGTAKVLRMIVLRIVLVLFVCSWVSTAHGETRVYTGLNVHKPTISLWEKAVQGASFDSISWVWNLGTSDRKHKNGSRDTILMVPNTTIPDDITLIVWFHGCGGFSKKTFSNRIIPQMEDIVEDGNSVAIAIPEMPWSTNTKTRCGRQGRVWTKPGELIRYVESLKEHLETWAVVTHGTELGSVRLVFVGHSAGGSAIMSSALEGSLCKLKPEAIVWSDASYGYWLDRTWKSCVRDLGQDTELHILVRKWDKPHKNAERVRKKWRRTKSKSNQEIKVHYYILSRKYWTHGRIGNSVFKITSLFPPGC